MVKAIKEFLKTHFFTDVETAIIFIPFVFVFLYQLIMAFIHKGYLNAISEFLLAMGSESISIISVFFSIIMTGLVSIGKIIGKNVKKAYRDKLVGHEDRSAHVPIKSYVGIIKSDEYNKPYTLDQLTHWEEATAEFRSPVYLSKDVIRYGRSLSTTEWHPLIYQLQSQGFYIARTHHLQKFAELIECKHRDSNSAFKYIFLTGQSGAGKSAFLSMLQKRLLEKKKYGVYFFPFSYDIDSQTIADQLNELDNRKKWVVIFDQFENHLRNPNLDQNFWKATLYENHANKLFIFSCSITSLGAVFSNVCEQNGIDSLYFLSVDSKDKKDLAILANRHQETDPVKKRILEKIYGQVQNGKLPLAAMQLIGNLLEEQVISTSDERFLSRMDEMNAYPEKLINLYLEDWLEIFDYQELGISILYLLSDGKTYSLEDIQNTTLLGMQMYSDNPRELAFKISSNKFIEYTNESRFHIVHDYLSEQILQFCKLSPYLTELMRASIDYYRDEILGSDLIQRSAERYTNYVSRNKKTNTSYNSSLLYFFLFCTIKIPCFISFKQGFGCSFLQNFELSAISICCMLSIYYIYYFCKYFCRVYKFSYLYLAVLGCIAMSFCFVFPHFWGCFIGGEIIVLAIYMYCISRKLNHNGKKVFKGSSISFFPIGLVIIALGFIYAYLHGISLPNQVCLIIDFGFFGLFIIFIGISITAHIKASYMYERLGLTNMFI